MRIGVVNKVNGNLQFVKVFNWDRSFDLDHKNPKVMRKLGLKQAPDRWVDVDERPDIKDGDPFPPGPPPAEQPAE